MHKILLLVFCLNFLSTIFAKYMEGELKTIDDWAFLTRFCFIPEKGTLEYYIEFKNEQGYPNLLLYYDTDDQWPAVYKTDKTCRQKESVLHPEQNQIVNLTTPSINSGCTYHFLTLSNDNTHGISTPTKTTAATFTLNLNELAAFTSNKRKFTTVPTVITTIDENATDTTTQLYNDNLFGEQFDTDDDDNNNDTVIIKKRSVQSINIPALITCRNVRKFKSSRSRWWFVAVSNCDAGPTRIKRGINIRYQILMTNGPPGDYWHEHFSADEFYVLPVLLAFTLAYILLIFSIIVCSVELKSRQLLHTTYKVYVFSVVLELSGIALTTMAYLKYAVSGILPYRTKILGGILMAASETIFLLLLLLLAKGYTITRARLRLSATVKITVFMCLYAITYLTLFIYEAKVFDPGEVLYIYESPAGYGLIVLRIIAWWMFVYATVFTLKHYPEKSNFYYPFNVCGTLWFVAGPAFILSANSYVDKWVRESVVCGVLLFITFSGHLMFLILTLPSMANKNFPYHIRTTQIGVMETHGATGAGVLDHFNHNAYQPQIQIGPNNPITTTTTTTRIEQTIIIPLNPQSDDEEEEEEEEYTYPTKTELKLETKPEQNAIATAATAHFDNVLRWSTVKGYISPIEIGYQDKTATPSSSSTPQPTSPGFIFTNGRKYNEEKLSEWSRDVPIELFTISKMVVNKTNK